MQHTLKFIEFIPAAAALQRNCPAADHFSQMFGSGLLQKFAIYLLLIILAHNPNPILMPVFFMPAHILVLDEFLLIEESRTGDRNQNCYRNQTAADRVCQTDRQNDKQNQNKCQR